MGTNKAPRMSEEEYEKAKIHWPAAYIVSLDGDPHSVFARLMGVDRNRAKELCYIFQYKHHCWMFKAMRRESRVRGKLSMEIMYNSRANGMPQTIYQILRSAEDAVDADYEKKSKEWRDKNV